MSSFATRCGLDTPAWQAAVARTTQLLRASDIELVRLAWCDVHGVTRCKTLVTEAAIDALHNGVGMVSTLLLKDTSDRTAFKVFEASISNELPGFEFASNLLLMPDPHSLHILPWVDNTAWLQCQPWFPNAQPVALDSRYQLQSALARLAEQGLGLKCGLEIEFHIYRLQDATHGKDLDPDLAAWPGRAPAVSMIHPGYRLLSEHDMDQCEEPLRIVQRTAQGLGLPLLSLEIEFGPSQVEAVFSATDALTAADNMVLFRNAVRQALRRAGYHATFMCRPPFQHIMSSGWHLHQSLVELDSGRNALMRDAAVPHTQAQDARHTLSDLGAHYLAGLLDHAQGSTLLCTPTANGYGRFQPNALAPQSIVWGRDNRGAMLRVIGQAGDPATRIENRLGEPAANPYLYMASQIHAGLAGMAQQRMPPLATEAPYQTPDGDDTGRTRIPSHLGEALNAFQADAAMAQGFGDAFVRYYSRIKQAEQQRFEAAEDTLEFQRREYFARI
ncbi:glutamine synthetase [Limnohabitans sp. JirII-29]|uniref:glutamine synthetase family protein n=1 Tax=Limnohabitans sp. JirII-29 TaxID=1835756 RepID=UPI000D37ECE8|nr:glutamine synthetase family protein [Limnohabitans sp. JirII-29]PUE29312.1 glutamine synthetase [Limnohabitans sp. JirII-29]